MTEDIKINDNSEKNESPLEEAAPAAPEAPASAAPAEAASVPETPAAAAPAEGEAPASRPQTQTGRTDRRPARPYQGGREQRFSRFKRKVCRFCTDKSAVIDYKRSEILERFITDRGKILPRRVTGTCARHQRDLAKAIKRARIIALLPFLEK